MAEASLSRNGEGAVGDSGVCWSASVTLQVRRERAKSSTRFRERRRDGLTTGKDFRGGTGT
jgi:hypothetical protein